MPKHFRRCWLLGLQEMKGIKNFVQGSVVQLSREQATLESGETIPFDYCAICAGSNYPSDFAKAPGDSTTLSGRVDQLQVRYFHTIISD